MNPPVKTWFLYIVDFLFIIYIETANTHGFMTFFTSKQTRQYYNEDDALYRSFWGEDGSCHWGLFTDQHISFSDAMSNLTNKMLAISHIDQTSCVLDLACGNGLSSCCIHETTGAEIYGLDLSDIHIQHAKNNALQRGFNGVQFVQGNAIDLPFDDNTFSHIWCQSSFYHIHDKSLAFQEINRVLSIGGFVVLDDLLYFCEKISDQAQRYLFDRLLFSDALDFSSYEKLFSDYGFEITFQEDLSVHLKKSYEALINILQNKIAINEYPQFHNRYEELIVAYKNTIELVQKNEIGYGLFVAKKIASFSLS